jgi:DNA modification methylase
MNLLTTQVDRYPAKMVVRLADTLIEKYTQDCTHLFDPFCGSGAILHTGKKKGLNVSGVDVNPYAVLLSGVKLEGFDRQKAKELCIKLISNAKTSTNNFPVSWQLINYWFTKATLNKYERLRYFAKQLCLFQTAEGRAVLLAFALSVRRCSLADQRSPKPFISKDAIKTRKGKHFCPFKDIAFLFDKLSSLYGEVSDIRSSVNVLDFSLNGYEQISENSFSHVITSPPYINAQDYFRNFQLELYLLEGVLPFKVDSFKSRFIGTERGNLVDGISKDELVLFDEILPCLREIKKIKPKSAAIIQRYFHDMSRSFDTIKKTLRHNGTFVLVCGDNLISGFSIPTWHSLNQILQIKGFSLFDKFGDVINRRALPPMRQGHKGLIKEEIVSAFKLIAK